MSTSSASVKRQVQNLFSQQATEWASYYDDPDPPLNRQLLFSRLRLALEMVQAVAAPAASVLDAGCGSGVLAAKLLAEGYAVWGMDFAAPMIRTARALCGSRPWAVGDIEHMPFPDNTFDAVVSLGVIEYLDVQEHALREIRRVLKPGGWAVITVPNDASPLRRLDDAVFRLSLALRPIYHFVQSRIRGRRLPRSDRRPRTASRQDWRFYRSRWLRLLRDSEFEVEQWVCHGWGWLQTPLLRRGLERVVGRARLARAGDRIARSPALQWLGGEHLFRVRAVK